MKSDTEADDLTDEEEVEEKLVYLELDNKHEFSENTKLEIMGLDQEKPLVMIDGVTYRGVWEDALGTLLFLEETPADAHPDRHNPLLRERLDNVLTVTYKTDKLLKMKRCVIVKNQDPLEDIRKVLKRNENGEEEEDSSEEDNIDDFYHAKNVKLTATQQGKTAQPEASHNSELPPQPSPEACHIPESSTTSFQPSTSQNINAKFEVYEEEEESEILTDDENSRLEPAVLASIKAEPEESPSKTFELSNISVDSLMERSQRTLSQISDFMIVDPAESPDKSGRDSSQE